MTVSLTTCKSRGEWLLGYPLRGRQLAIFGMRMVGVVKTAIGMSCPGAIAQCVVVFQICKLEKPDFLARTPSLASPTAVRYSFVS